MCVLLLEMVNGGDSSDALYKPGGLIIEFQFFRNSFAVIASTDSTLLPAGVHSRERDVF